MLTILFIKKVQTNYSCTYSKEEQFKWRLFSISLKKVEIVRVLNPLLDKNRIFDTFFISIFHLWCNSGLWLWAPWSSRTSGRGTLQILLSLLAELFPLNRKKVPKSRKKEIDLCALKNPKTMKTMFLQNFYPNKQNGLQFPFREKNLHCSIISTSRAINVCKKTNRS